jgi:hypothetical protein
VEKHQGEQAVHLGLVGHQFGERTAEPHRFGGEVHPAAVALVEDQVDDGEHRGDAVGQQIVRRHPERDPGVPDLRLRADQPLRHRRLRDEERARDLLGGQAAQRPQRERHLRLGGERRVAAGEDQLEALVGELELVHVVLNGLPRLEQAGLVGERAVAADAIDRAIARGRDQPRARIVGGAVAWPALGGDRERLLRGFLGELEVAEEADQRGEDAAPLVAKGLL